MVEKFDKKIKSIKHMLLAHCVPTTYATENFEINAYQASCPLALPLYNMSSCQSMLKYLSPYGILCILT